LDAAPGLDGADVKLVGAIDAEHLPLVQTEDWQSASDKHAKFVAHGVQ